ncbi:alpha/beta fold hydrolase [Micromonospora sp. NPDC050397]|uniref:alpha/beta fold hydrolase n=1 Tax=Micromonospora sp. NPDC050397 TaxID=3364279 RepID=UPI00384E38FF
MGSESRAYVLIPGAWHGGWSWRPVAERLRAAGHAAYPVTLPGLGDGDDPSGWRLRDAVEHVVRLVRERRLGRVTLVAHSWGGYPTAGVAYELRGQVDEVVYYNAHVPVPNQSMIDNDPPEAAAFLRGLIEASPDRAIHPTLDFVRNIFMPGVAEEMQRLVADLLTPQPGGYLLDAPAVPSVDELGIPARYLLGEDDRAMPRPGAEFAARIGLSPIMVPGAHEGLLTHPDGVANAILGNATGTKI